MSYRLVTSFVPHTVLTGFNGMLPLHKATMRADVNLMDFFIKQGADVNCVNNFNESPLLFAAKRGIPSVIIDSIYFPLYNAGVYM